MADDLSRRETLAWMARAGLTVGVAPIALSACDGGKPEVLADLNAPGYGRDPNLLEPKRPWPLTLDAAQRATLARLADLILPGDAHGPAPSSIGIATFFDEWISAPYPDQRADRRIILPGLAALDRDASGNFATVGLARAAALLDRLAKTVPVAGPERKKDFFITVRRLCLLGYYTSEPGLRDIGHVEAIAATSFPGPPAEVRARLGI